MDGEEKLWRYGLLANELAARGHNVTRWAPTFEHVHKRQRFLNNRTVCLNEKYKIEFLFAKGYQKNISFARLRFNRKIAQSFSQALFQEKKPDVIVAGIPTPEMTAVAIDFGRRVGIPVIVDIRDLWPEIYLIVLPKPFRWFGRLALIPSFNKMKRIMRRAAAIIGVSESYLTWGVALAGRKRRDTDRVFPLGYSEKVIEPRLLEGEREKWIKSGADPKKFICCFFGQFEASYDLETVIDAAKAFSEAGDDHLQFILCGMGKRGTELKKRAFGLRNVFFPGWVSQLSIRALMQISAVGLAAYSKNALQSLPNKPIEYLSEGLPVISSLKGDLEKLLFTNDCGITYKAGDVKAFMSAVKNLSVDHHKRQEMSQNARFLFKTTFAADRVFPAMASYLEDIVDAQRSRSNHGGK